MKLVLALVFGLVVFATADHHNVKEWMHGKIMEDCLGAPVANELRAKCYEAYANCTGTVVPQLFLPQYSEKIREIKADAFQAFLAALPPKAIASEEDTIKIVASGDHGSIAMQTSRNARHIGDADKFKEKIKASYEERKAKMEKDVCVLKYMKYVDDDLDLDIEKLVEIAQLLDVPAWLKNRMANSMWKCYSLVHSLPDELLETDPSFVKLAKIKPFFRCFKDQILNTCMNQDMLLKLEANFGDVKTITEKTGMSENELANFAEMMFLGPLEYD